MTACQAKATSSQGVPGLAAVLCKDQCLLRPQAEAAVTQKAAADTTRMLLCRHGLNQALVIYSSTLMQGQAPQFCQMLPGPTTPPAHILDVLPEGMHVAIAHSTLCQALPHLQLHFVGSMQRALPAQQLRHAAQASASPPAAHP